MSNLYAEICSYENLESAFHKARKGKTLKLYVITFEADLKHNLLRLQQELILQTYKPKPLETFILRDPKTRKISKSDFRDRVIHHALCNVIEPFFEKSFISDSFANRKGKGTLKAIERFDYCARKVSHGFTRGCFVLKADIRHYFETVDHDILISILQKKIPDERVISLIKIILANHQTAQIGKGMPLGNLTSQFFANVYLNELDQFVKHQLKVHYYIRYVDDFVIIDSSWERLQEFKVKIDLFLRTHLQLTLHPDKSRILRLENGVPFLGMRLYPHHKRIIKKNVLRFDRKLSFLKSQYDCGFLEREKAVETLEGWMAYISYAHTFKYRKHVIRQFNNLFPLTPQDRIQNLRKHQNLVQKTEESDLLYSVQKTLFLWKEKKNIAEIAKLRGIKEKTVWQHLANLVEYNQLSVWKTLPKEKVTAILSCIISEKDKLKEIKARCDSSITYDEINCVIAYVKSKNRVKSVFYHVNWYQKVHCLRKCYFNKRQRTECSGKLDFFISCNLTLKMKREDFVNFFNNFLTICILPEKEKRMYITWDQFQQIRSLGKKSYAKV